MLLKSAKHVPNILLERNVAKYHSAIIIVCAYVQCWSITFDASRILWSCDLRSYYYKMSKLWSKLCGWIPRRLGNHTGHSHRALIPLQLDVKRSEHNPSRNLGIKIRIKIIETGHSAQLVSSARTELTHAKPADRVMKWAVGFIPRRCLLYTVSLLHRATYQHSMYYHPTVYVQKPTSKCETSLRYVHWVGMIYFHALI